MEDQNEKSALNNIVNAEPPSERNKEKGEKKGEYYISTIAASHFCKLTLRFDANPNLQEQNTYGHCLYFEKEEDAKELLLRIKQCIFNFYHPDGPNYSNEYGRYKPEQACPDWLDVDWMESESWNEYVEKMKSKMGNLKKLSEGNNTTNEDKR